MPKKTHARTGKWVAGSGGGEGTSWKLYKISNKYTAASHVGFALAARFAPVFSSPNGINVQGEANYVAHLTCLRWSCGWGVGAANIRLGSLGLKQKGPALF